MAESYKAGDAPVPGIKLTQSLAAAHAGNPAAHWLASLSNGQAVSLRIATLDPERIARLENALELIPELDHPNLVRLTGMWVRGSGALRSLPIRATAATGAGPGGTLMMAAQPPELAAYTDWFAATERGERDVLARLEECRKQGQYGIHPDELLAYLTDVAAALDFLHRKLGRAHGRLRASEIWLSGRVARLAGWELALTLENPPGAIGGPAAIDQYALAMTYARLRTGIPCEPGDEPAGKPPTLLLGALAGLTVAERQVLERALASNPETRFGAVLEMVKALRGACGGDTVRSSASKTFVVENRGSTAPSPTIAEMAAEIAADVSGGERPAQASQPQPVQSAPEPPVLTPSTPAPKLPAAGLVPPAEVFTLGERLAGQAPRSETTRRETPRSETPRSETPRSETPKRSAQTVVINSERERASAPTVLRAPESPGRSSMNEQESGQTEPTAAMPPAPAPENRAPPTVRITPDTIRSQVDPHSATVMKPALSEEDLRAPLNPPAAPPSAAPPPAPFVDSSGSGLDISPSDRGSDLGDYVLLGKLGGGSMGSVYKAMHRYMQRQVALKVMNEFSLADPEARERFLREAETAARLSHPNIVACYNAGSHGPEHYLAMEFVAGRDLFHVVDREGALSVRTALGYVLQAARGLDYAHQQGIVHRDIKPGNLMLDAEGVVKILDMGLARLREPAGDKPAMLTRTGTMMGTIDYMPPEQAKNSKMADERADVYSLGCTFHYLVTGRAPFPARSLVDSIVAHRENPPPHLASSVPGVSERVQAWFERTLAKRPEDRFQTMREVILAIEECLLHDTLDASTGTVILPPGGAGKREQPKTILSASSATIIQQPQDRLDQLEQLDRQQPKTILSYRGDSPTVVSSAPRTPARDESLAEPSTDAQSAALLAKVAERLAATPVEEGLSKQAWKMLAIVSALTALALFVMRVLGV